MFPGFGFWLPVLGFARVYFLQFVVWVPGFRGFLLDCVFVELACWVWGV